MRGSAMKNFAGILRVSGAAAVALAACGALLLPCSALAQGQDKSAPSSQVQRLGRAPVNKEILRVQLPRPTVVTAEERTDDCAGRRSQAADGRVHDVDSSGTTGGPERPAGAGVVYGGNVARRNRKTHQRADRERSGFAGSVVGRDFAVRCELYVGECVGSDHATPRKFWI